MAECIRDSGCVSSAPCTGSAAAKASPQNEPPIARWRGSLGLTADNRRHQPTAGSSAQPAQEHCRPPVADWGRVATHSTGRKHAAGIAWACRLLVGQGWAGECRRPARQGVACPREAAVVTHVRKRATPMHGFAGVTLKCRAASPPVCSVITAATKQTGMSFGTGTRSVSSCPASASAPCLQR